MWLFECAEMGFDLLVPQLFHRLTNYIVPNGGPRTRSDRISSLTEFVGVILVAECSKSDAIVASFDRLCDLRLHVSIHRGAHLFPATEWKSFDVPSMLGLVAAAH